LEQKATTLNGNEYIYRPAFKIILYIFSDHEPCMAM